MMKKLLSILLAAALIASLAVQALASYEVESGSMAASGMAVVDGVLYVADTGSHRILTVTGGRVEVLAGARLTGDAAYEGGYLDGSAGVAMFSGPQGVAVGPDGSVYIADTGNSAVRVLRGGVVTTLAAAGDSDTWPVSPRALLVYNGLLYVGDVFSRSTGVIDVRAGALPFEDVAAGAWYYDAVAFVSANGLFDGTSETAFSPNGQMTRAMVITVLARHAGIDTSVGATWYDAAVDWALETGVSDGSDLEGSITREQLATMLYREAGSPAVSGSLEGYVDAGEVSDWAVDAMLWAVAGGIIEGAGGNALTPTTPATRAQTAAILQRYITQS